MNHPQFAPHPPFPQREWGRVIVFLSGGVDLFFLGAMGLLGGGMVTGGDDAEGFGDAIE